MFTEAAGYGWRFVPIPGVLPLPREVKDDEYYPLHARLVSDQEGWKCQSYPHKHIQFMGDDGVATLWQRIESKPFFDHVLTWYCMNDKFLYGAKLVHVRASLETDIEALAKFMTAYERAQIAEEAKWKNTDVHWVMLD